MKSTLIASAALALVLAACSKPAPPPPASDTDQTEVPTNETVMIVDSIVPVSCDENSNNLQRGTARLHDVGVNPTQSQCAQLNDAVFTTVCGSPTGRFFIHEIDSEDIQKVEAQGFRPLDDIAQDEFFGQFKNDAGKVNFTVVDCQN